MITASKNPMKTPFSFSPDKSREISLRLKRAEGRIKTLNKSTVKVLREAGQAALDAACPPKLS